MEKIDLKNTFPCQLPHLNLSCWGCCGRDFQTKKQIDEDIRINTQDFFSMKNPNEEDLKEFRDRYSDDPNALTPSGICSNLVNFENGCYACPLHPMINKLVSKKVLIGIDKKDLRKNHCDINYECGTFILWKMMSEKQKIEYIEWLSTQKFDHYEYSIGNIEERIIRKFLDETYENK